MNEEMRITRALEWITLLLEQRQIPYKVSGGLAARVHGATRPLADIDIDMPDSRLLELEEICSDFITRPLGAYEDESWRIKLLTLSYHGQEIDLVGAGGEIFNVQQGCWEGRRCNLDERLLVDLYGTRTWVDTRENLLRYKQVLGRPVDVKDCNEMLAATF